MVKKTGIYILVLTIILTVVTGLGTNVAYAAGIDITINGAANATIVIPASPTTRETFAAGELQKYIQKMSGATLPIMHDNDTVTGNMILIGGPSRNTKTAAVISTTSFNAAVPGPEGLLIQTFGSNTLVLAGSVNTSTDQPEYERGTIYAVYEFLEAMLGCSFAAYGYPGLDMGEYVPNTPSINIGVLNYTKARADNPYRTAIAQVNANPPLNIPFFDWLIKNDYNRILVMDSVYETWKGDGTLTEVQKRGLLLTVGHHESSMLFLPPDGNSYFSEHYYTTHPEYYRLQNDGTRYHSTSWNDGQWIFCSRNTNGINQVAANINSWLSLNTYVDMVCLWPQDMTAPNCTCSLCSPYSLVQNYAYFVGQVASQVRAVHSNAKIDMLVYMSIWACPSGLTLPSYVYVDESTWAGGLRYIGKNDGTSFIGAYCETNARNWSDTGASVVFYDYYVGNGGAYYRYMPAADEIDDISAYFKNSTSYHYKGTGNQIDNFKIWNSLFNGYVFGRELYDSSRTIADRTARFCRIFGAGASYINSYITYAESIVEGQSTIDQAGIFFAQNANKTTVYNYFTSAYNAETNETLRNNIRMLRMVFRYSDLLTNGGGSAELKYIHDNFDGYTHSPGYPVYFPQSGSGTFTPDYWYDFNANSAQPYTVDDRDPSITYSGTWTSYNDPGDYLGTEKYGNTTNGYFQFTFTGTAVKWISPKSSVLGKADVYIDGVLDTAGIDCYSPTVMHQQVLYNKTGLSSGTHTIKVVVTGTKNPSSGNTFIISDAFQYTPSTGTKVDDRDPSITYSGSWTNYSDPNDYSGTEKYGNTVNGYFQMTFTGTQISWISPKSSVLGKADVYIDGVLDTSGIDCYSPTVMYQQVLYNKTGLSNGMHTIKVVVTGTKNPSSGNTFIISDAFQYQ